MSEQDEQVTVELPAIAPSNEMPEEIREKLDAVVQWVFGDMQRAAAAEAEKLGVSEYELPGGTAQFWGVVNRGDLPELRTHVTLTIADSGLTDAQPEELASAARATSDALFNADQGECPCPKCEAKRAAASGQVH